MSESRPTAAAGAAAPVKFVDLYRLLELQPLESDRGVIEKALRKAELAGQGSSEAANTKRAARLVALGQKHLLDEKHKEAYDRRWQAYRASQTEAHGREVRRTAAVATAAPSVARDSTDASDADWNWQLFGDTLPSEDPCRPFDLAAYCESPIAVAAEDHGSDVQKLRALLAGAPATPAAVAAPTVAVSTARSNHDSLRRSQVTNQASPAAPTQPQPQSAFASQPAARSKPASLAKKIRKKRDRSLLGATLGLLLSAAAVLGVIFVVVNWTQDDARRPEMAANPIPVQPNAPVETPAVAPSSAPTPRRSGLPQVPGAEVLQGSLQGANDGTAADSTPEAMDASQGDPEMAAEPAPGSPAMDSATSDKPGPATALPKEPPTLNEAEKQAWQQMLVDIREQLGNHDYVEAKSQLSAAESLAVTQPQQDQLIRLKTAAALAEDAFRALTEAIAGLEAGASFQVGPRTIAFVDGDDTSLVIRLEGQRKSYLLKELPVGLFLGLVDLELDVLAQSSLARKAAFIVFHPANSDLSMQNARQWMQEAVDADVVPPSIMLVFDDDYSL